MKISDDSNTDGYFIRSYAPGRITVASKQLSADTTGETAPSESRFKEETLENSFIISANRLIKDWPPQTIDDLTNDHSKMLLSLQPEVIILGTGMSLRFPNPVWSASFLEHSIGLEVMDTGAACRTYGILSADGRNVVAAFILN